jgi:hypothetical protein
MRVVNTRDVTRRNVLVADNIPNCLQPLCGAASLTCLCSLSWPRNFQSLLEPDANGPYLETVHNLTYCIYTIHLNVILLSTPTTTRLQSEQPCAGIDAPITLGQSPSLSAHESESMLRTYPVCREKQANGAWDKHTVY